MNKAPDIIYLTRELAGDEYDYLWCRDRVTDEDIKYIRADKCCKEAVRVVANAALQKVFGLEPDKYKVLGDHPTLARCDKYNLPKNEAKSYADSLEAIGYENVSVTLDKSANNRKRNTANNSQPINDETYIQNLYEYINNNPRLLSLLYDIDLLPEQTMDDPKLHIKTLRIADAWRDDDKEA